MDQNALERIESLEALLHSQQELNRGMAAAFDGIQRQLECLGRIVGHLISVIALIRDDERPEVQELSAKAAEQIRELERLANLGGELPPEGNHECGPV